MRCYDGQLQALTTSMQRISMGTFANRPDECFDVSLRMRTHRVHARPTWRLDKWHICVNGAVFLMDSFWWELIVEDYIFVGHNLRICHNEVTIRSEYCFSVSPSKLALATCDTPDFQVCWKLRPLKWFTGIYIYIACDIYIYLFCCLFFGITMATTTLTRLPQPPPKRTGGKRGPSLSSDEDDTLDSPRNSRNPASPRQLHQGLSQPLLSSAPQTVCPPQLPSTTPPHSTDVPLSPTSPSISTYGCEHDHDYENVASPNSSTASGPIYVRPPGFKHHAQAIEAKSRHKKKKTTTLLSLRDGLKKREQTPPKYKARRGMCELTFLIINDLKL